MKFSIICFKVLVILINSSFLTTTTVSTSTDNDLNVDDEQGQSSVILPLGVPMDVTLEDVKMGADGYEPTNKQSVKLMTIEKRVEVPVNKYIPAPYPVEKPYPVPVIKHVPMKILVTKNIPYPVRVPVPKPVHVIKHVPIPIPMPVEKIVPIRVKQSVPFPVKVFVPVPSMSAYDNHHYSNSHKENKTDERDPYEASNTFQYTNMIPKAMNKLKNNLKQMLSHGMNQPKGNHGPPNSHRHPVNIHHYHTGERPQHHSQHHLDNYKPAGSLHDVQTFDFDYEEVYKAGFKKDNKPKPTKKPVSYHTRDADTHSYYEYNVSHENERDKQQKKQILKYEKKEIEKPHHNVKHSDHEQYEGKLPSESESNYHHYHSGSDYKEDYHSSPTHYHHSHDEHHRPAHHGSEHHYYHDHPPHQTYHEHSESAPIPSSHHYDGPSHHMSHYDDEDDGYFTVHATYN